jgi:hypothetical protein
VAVRKRMTFANVMSLVAVFIALGAGAFAAGLPRDSIKSKQIKDGRIASVDLADSAVTATKLADGAITTAKVADGAVDTARLAEGTVTGTDVADDSLTGTDIVETTLQDISVANAKTVGGLEIKKIDYQRPFVNGDVRSILEFPGIFRIDAQCATVGDGLDLAAFTAVANSRISMVGTRAVGADDHDVGNQVDMQATQDNVFNPGEAFAIDDNLPQTTSAHDIAIRFSTLEGFTATVDLYSAQLGNGCKVIGTAVGG